MARSYRALQQRIVIAGGGPVGLFLGCCLERLGLECTILEKSVAPGTQSRAIGIHPPALDLLDRLALLDRFLAKGVQIRSGHACSRWRRLGTVRFDGRGARVPYVLSIPQDGTEAVLDAHLRAIDPGRVIRGAVLEHFEASAEGVRAHYRREGTDEACAIEGAFLIGCDGKDSRVRDQAGIGFPGGPYPDTFAMGDFPDETDLGPDAYVFLGPEGLVESFPLPGGLRRWVLRTAGYWTEPQLGSFCTEVRARTAIEIRSVEGTELTAFTARRHLAERFSRGRIILAGDAAHVLSPIGGQGMNLGWLNAWELAEALAAVQHGAARSPASLLDEYERRARRRAIRAMRRAELNMSLGRISRSSRRRNLLVFLLLHSPVKRRLERMFTMRDL